MVQGGNFTTKAQEAVMSAQNIAQAKGQQQVDTIHLLNALLNQKESIVLTLLDKLGVDVANLLKK